jgi:hypothetical protein
MVTIRTSETHPLHIDIAIHSPSIYLDQCVIGDFSEETSLGESFRRLVVSKHGTLCISALHLVELAGLCPGKSYSRIQDFLASFGNQFAILEFDPGSVISKEHGSDNERLCAPIDIELTKELVLKRDGLSEINLGVLLNIVAINPKLIQILRDAHLKHKESILSIFRASRQIYQTDPKAKENVNNKKCPDPSQSSLIEYLFCEARRICMRQDLSLNDSFDFFHSIVSTSYTDFVVLDKKWAARMRNIPSVPGVAAVFATNEYEQLFKALAAS